MFPLMCKKSKQKGLPPLKIAYVLGPGLVITCDQEFSLCRLFFSGVFRGYISVLAPDLQQFNYVNKTFLNTRLSLWNSIINKEF